MNRFRIVLQTFSLTKKSALPLHGAIWEPEDSCCALFKSRRTLFDRTIMAVRKYRNLSEHTIHPTQQVFCHCLLLLASGLMETIVEACIALLSNTAEGLQNALNKLGNFCETWNLKINISKTKVIVFNKSGKLLKGFSFTYMQMAIEIVQEYTYLGIIFKPSGIFSHAIKYLYNKALKAMFCVRQALKAESINTELYLTIYEHCIKPILLYCSEIWSIDFLINKAGQTEIAQRYDLLLPEKLQLRFLKSVMGGHKYANNNTVKQNLVFSFSYIWFKKLVELLDTSCKFKQHYICR